MVKFWTIILLRFKFHRELSDPTFLHVRKALTWMDQWQKRQVSICRHSRAENTIIHDSKSCM